MAKLMEKECITGQTEKCMTVSGARESKKGTVCGRESMEIATWDSGASQRHMDMEFISGKMGIGMKAAGSIVSNMEKVVTSLQMAILSQGSTIKEDLKAKESTTGRTEAYILVTLRME